MFATLRGPLFALGDEELLDYHARMKAQSEGHAFHPYHVLEPLPDHLGPVSEALVTITRASCGT